MRLGEAAIRICWAATCCVGAACGFGITGAPDAPDASDAGSTDDSALDGSGGCVGPVASVCASGTTASGDPCLHTAADACGSHFMGFRTETCAGYSALIFSGIDSGFTEYFDLKSGELVAIVDYSPFMTTCVAGPPDFVEPSCAAGAFLDCSVDAAAPIPKGGRPDASLAGDGGVDADAGGSTCAAKTCAQQGFTCGPNSDGCGNVIRCGSCGPGDYCGGGGYSKCGNPSRDGGCVPMTCADFPASCGQHGDGCGGLTASCSPAAVPPWGCPYQLDACTPLTCADLPAGTCGPQADGCGGLTANCNPCVAPQFCGGGPSPSTCGGHPGIGPDGGPITCVPTTCAALGNPCGDQGNGCGGMLTCATCTAPAFCGGGGPGVCGTGDAGAADGAASD